jgi:FKBP-type peptidyl-prolyl cis-trans isomerase
MVSGIKILEEIEGQGVPIEKGDVVEFESQGFLNRGDQVQDRMVTRTKIGKREVIAGIEKSLMGMKEGGYRKVKLSPHLTYKDQGVAGLIPPDAVLIYELWVKKVETPL